MHDDIDRYRSAPQGGRPAPLARTLTLPARQETRPEQDARPARQGGPRPYTGPGTGQEFHADSTGDGPVQLLIKALSEQVRIFAGPGVRAASLLVHTPDTSGEAAARVRAARITQDGPHLSVSFPLPGASTAHAPIHVDVLLPQDSGVFGDLDSGSLTAHGPLADLKVRTTSGNITAACVGRLVSASDSGALAVEHVLQSLKVTSVRGPVQIERYSGGQAHIVTLSAPVELTATAQAHGFLYAQSESGPLHLAHTSHLNVQASTDCAPIRRT